ncbi:hypothetical protein LTR84_005016 [Exophiala bonariae]|uniref:Uncharacterized protein n=1 Tax=Exophiala bonariae TaxID=1690606 RepID=A0AAV9NSK7_9EURO|nr:hypothetical protein LTR84_005016 [Exophiala bonariae]
MVPPVGIIITVTVLVAASLAAYENPQVRAWIDRTRQKIATGFNSLGDGPRPSPRTQRRSTDASMYEEKSEDAEARRQRAVAEIMERSRLMEEQRRRRRAELESGQPQSPNFDSLVDSNGNLREKPRNDGLDQAATSALEPTEQQNQMRSRFGAQDLNCQPNLQQRGLQKAAEVVSPLSESIPTPVEDDNGYQPFESRYEQEMREAWNIPLSERRIDIPSSHASESLVVLTPSTDVPDPEISIPSADHLHRPVERSDYFSAPMSNSTRTLSEHGSIPLGFNNSLHSSQMSGSIHHSVNEPSSHAPSISGSISEIHASEAEDTSDDLLSEQGDGMRTPGSVWTEVDSTFSGDH